MRNSVVLILGIVLISSGCDSMDATQEGPVPVPGMSQVTIKQETELAIFMPAGDVGGGVLVPGEFFPPTEGSKSVLKRKADRIEYNVSTTGLPPGAYTNWIVTIDNPGNCLTSPCTDVDVFERTEEVGATVFWAAGKTVNQNGKGNFSATIKVGVLPTGDDQVGWPLEGATGLQNPLGGEFHIIVKYHGLTSQDPEIRKSQLSTLTGSCSEGANAFDFGPGFGIQCFDPQVAIHSPE